MTTNDIHDKLSSNKYYPYLQAAKVYEAEQQGLSKDEMISIWKAENEENAKYMNKYTNPYINISHAEEKLLFSFIPSDEILIQEKVDGSNTHLIVSENGFESFGMNYKLNEHNHLQGFWYWCKDNFQKVKPCYYGLKIYGEWLVPHHCEYTSDKYFNFYVFDIMDGNKYWEQEKVEQFCSDCGFTYVPVFYKGPFISWKHVQNYIGKTVMGVNTGEGIVIKNMSRLNNANKTFYLKLVSREFQETNPAREIVKTISGESLEKADNIALLVSSVVTEARVRKIILKMVDINMLPFSWKEMDVSKIDKIIKSSILKDCRKEAMDVWTTVGNKFPVYADELIRNYIRKFKKEQK